ncbi:MAG: beta-galactosidase [Fidelibacterota bacterium]|nr:MAG: beta-galactosidase [Candidatus Neomarinimicrobiota bacterium]
MKIQAKLSIRVLVMAGVLSLLWGKGPNLVPNSSFEELTLSIPPINFQLARPANATDPPEYRVNIPDSWRIVSGYSRGYLPKEQGWGVADQGHTGEHSLYLGDAPAFPAWYSEDFPIKPDAAHLAEAYIQPSGMGYHDYVRIIFSILDQNGNCLGYEQIVSARAETRNIRSSDFGELDWRHKQVYIRPRPGQAKMRIIIRLINTGVVYVDDIAVSALTPSEAAELEPPFNQKTPVPRKVRKQPRIQATGFYRVAKVEGVWWLVDPEGRLTWSIGIQSMGNILWENPALSKLIEEKYGGDQSRYLQDQIPRLRNWNFTTSGSWSGPAFYELNTRLIARNEEPFPSFHFIGFTTVGDQEYTLRNREGIVNDFGEHAMVDPFNPEWRERAEEKVREITSLYTEIPWLVGYFVDNEINMRNLTKYLHTPHCRQELVRWLQERYADDIGALNTEWSVGDKRYRYGSFDQVGEDIPDEDPSPKAEEALRGFVRHLMKSYIDFTVDIIHKHDPNHLIIGNRFALGTKTRGVAEVGGFIDLFSRYDIVCTNLYAQSGGSYGPDQMALLQYLHEKTGRPLLIGEFSFHANESNIPLDRWGGKIVATMGERGEAYNRTMLSWSYLPYMVGAHFYKWCNGYGPVGRYRGRNAGIVNDQNEPYQPFVKMVTETNDHVLHARRKAGGHVNDFEYIQ